ncbi:unnamed protein product, partial [Rotaria sp. Silwood1]
FDLIFLNGGRYVPRGGIFYNYTVGNVIHRVVNRLGNGYYFNSFHRYVVGIRSASCAAICNTAGLRCRIGASRAECGYSVYYINRNSPNVYYDNSYAMHHFVIPANTN